MTERWMFRHGSIDVNLPNTYYIKHLFTQSHLVVLHSGTPVIGLPSGANSYRLKVTVM